VHISDRALVSPRNGSDTPVEKLITIHDHSLPFAPRFAYLDPALKDIINRAEMAGELLLERVYFVGWKRM
jgi:hypothetical protein